MKHITVFICLFVFITPSSQADDIDTLVQWMAGSFSSQAQALADTSYFDIRLEMVPIWKELNDGYWIYVEQAVADHLDRPYRQRAYHVTEQEGGLIKSEVYSIPEPLRFAGDWRTNTPLETLDWRTNTRRETLSPDSLEVHEGCGVILKRESDILFTGSTVDNKCLSTLRGAAYATSEVNVGPDRIESWDRGFDKLGTHV